MNNPLSLVTYKNVIDSFCHSDFQTNVLWKDKFKILLSLILILLRKGISQPDQGVMFTWFIWKAFSIIAWVRNVVPGLRKLTEVLSLIEQKFARINE